MNPHFYSTSRPLLSVSAFLFRTSFPPMEKTNAALIYKSVSEQSALSLSLSIHVSVPMIRRQSQTLVVSCLCIACCQPSVLSSPFPVRTVRAWSNLAESWSSRKKEKRQNSPVSFYQRTSSPPEISSFRQRLEALNNLCYSPDTHTCS